MNIDETKQQMQKVLDVLRGDLGTVRAGKATPTLVENIMINAYGGTQRLKVMELATIVVSDPQTLVITPFDASIIGEIQKGIEAANVGLNPGTDGQLIRISIPPLSQERREQLIHLIKQKLENGRIMVRQVRQETMREIKKPFGQSPQGKQELSEDEILRLEKEAQRVTDETMEEIDSLGKRKEAELLAI